MPWSRRLFRALRAPAVLGAGVVLTAPAWLPSISNTARFLAYLLLLILLLEIREIFPRSESRRPDAALALGTFFLAAAPWFFFLRMEGLCVDLLPVRLTATVVLWAFLLFNAGLHAVEKRLALSPGLSRWMDWTFPVSEPVLYKLHRRRLGPDAGPLRFVPALCYMGILIFLLLNPLSILRSGIRPEKMPVRVYDPGNLWADENGLWYSDTVATTAGLWRYDAKSGKARPYLRSQDLRRFAFQDGFFYFYDSFLRELRRVDSRDRRLVWSIPLPEWTGEVEVWWSRGRIVAVGEKGTLAVVDPFGRIEAERRTPFEIRFPQLLPDGRVACAPSGGSGLRLLDPAGTGEEVLPLPGIPGRTVITGTAWIEPLQLLCAATQRGEIFRYDFRGRRWLTSYRAAPGIGWIAADARNGLLFAYNPRRGILEILRLESGERRAVVLAGPFVNTLMLDPEARAGILSVRGPESNPPRKPGGFYRFSYPSG